MKHILLSCILSGATFVSPVFTQPAAAQTQIESVQEMASWMQSATTIQTDLMSLFSADSMANMYSVINTGDVEAMRRLGQKFEAERQVVLARATRQIADLPPPEKWNIDRSLFSSKEKAIHAAAKIQYNSLNETYRLFETLTDALSDILKNSEDLDDDAFINLLSVQYEASVRLIELENEQVDGYLIAIPKSNPNHQFQKIVKQFNLAAIPELNIAMLSDTLEERQANAKMMGDELDKIRPLILRGQKNVKAEIRKIKAIPTQSLSSDLRVMMPIIVKVYENFEEAFTVEAKMLEAMQNSESLYVSDKSDEEIQPLIDKNDIAYFRLTETRAKLMQERLSLIQ